MPLQRSVGLPLAFALEQVLFLELVVRLIRSRSKNPPLTRSRSLLYMYTGTIPVKPPTARQFWVFYASAGIQSRGFSKRVEKLRSSTACPCRVGGGVRPPADLSIVHILEAFYC